jgi:hypothetical protein
MSRQSGVNIGQMQAGTSQDCRNDVMTLHRRSTGV